MNFDEAFVFVIGVEGGLSEDPNDPGGLTKYGISSRAHPGIDIRNLTLEQAKNIYLHDYWLAVGCPRLEPKMALLVFDTAVQHGVGRAREWLEVCPTTLAYLAKRLHFYTSLGDWQHFGRGWTRRIAKLLSRLSELEPLPGGSVTYSVYSEENDELGAVTVYPGEKVYVSDELRRNLRGAL